MWPWSTIARLTSQLREAQDDASRFAERAFRANTEAEQYRQRWVTLNENYEELKRHAGLAEKLLSVKAAEADALRNQLALAVKNDKRDPRTGRFVKSTPMAFVETAAGASSGEVGH